MRSRPLALACLLTSTLACAKTTDGPSMTAGPEVTSAPPSAEASREGDASSAREAGDASGTPGEGELVSVKPGVNDRYFEDGAVETWTETLEAERREVIANREGILAALELRPGMRVADVGAGTGAFLSGLSAGVGVSGQVYAVEIVPTFVEHLRERAAAEGLANVAVVEATTTDVGLAEGSVDLLFMCDVYHHIEFPSTYLPTLHRALQSEGRLVIVEFARIPGKTSARMMKHIRQDQATLVAELAAAGFHLEREITRVPLEENYMLVFRK